MNSFFPEQILTFSLVYSHSSWNIIEKIHIFAKSLFCMQSLRPNSWTKPRQKVLRDFRLAIHSHLYSFALRFLYSRNLLQFLQSSYCTLYRRKEENLIENHTPFSWFKKSIQKPQQLSRLCPQRKCTFMNLASGFF